jgi:hypothetical protein
MLTRVSSRILAIAFLAGLLPGFITAAGAHLVYGRRPFDYFVGKADALVVVSVKTPTKREMSQDGGATDVTEVLVVSCLAGACPKGTLLTAGADDHAPSLERDTKYVLALQKAPVQLRGGVQVSWRLLQNSWEAHALTPTYLDGVQAITPRFRAALALQGVEREKAYLDALVDQAGFPDPLLQADAIQSLLRFPPERATPAALKTIFSYLDRPSLSGASRLGLLIGSSTWNAPATRVYLRGANLNLFEEDNLARALNYLGSGNAEEAMIPCRWLHADMPTVRAAAVASCTPKDTAWTVVAIQGLLDGDSQVQKAAKNRLRKHPEAKPDVRRWSLTREPFWRRAYFTLTGSDPVPVSEIFTESGVANP